MALIKCSECGADMSDKAKACPKCGFENKIKFCPDCGKKISKEAIMCPECGRSFEKTMISKNSKGNMFGLSIGAFVCSFFFIINIVGFIMGGVVINANHGQKNTARSFGIAAVIISGISIVILLLIIIVWSIQWKNIQEDLKKSTYCSMASCNEDRSDCIYYGIEETWQGSCQDEY